MIVDTLLAMDPATLAAFVSAGVALNLTPGADVMFAMASGAQGGWRAGVAAAAGISLGSVFHICLTVLGIAAALQAVPHALDLLRWLGAGYLLWLAWQSWHADPARPVRGAAGLAQALRRGALTNILNPKVALFILAFLPQFADPAIGPVWKQLLALGLVFSATGFVITALYGALAGAFGGWIKGRMRLMNRFAALVFAGLAARLALT